MKLQKYIYVAVVLVLSHSISAQYIEVGPYCGAVSESSAIVVYKISLPDQNCRVAYAQEASFNRLQFSSTFTTSAENANYIKVALNDLEPETEYFYQLELNGKLLEQSQGKFQTFSDSSKSFSFAFGNSLKSESQKSGLMAAVDKDILFFLNTGDLHYDNIDEADLGLFRNSYQKALLRKDMSKMGPSVPFVYIWDDHDYGPNNSDKTAPGRRESSRAYRECIPHYPLVAKEKNGAIYQAFTVNNTRFVLTDLRSMRDQNKKPDSDQKSMMGKEQLTWFMNEIKASSLKYPLVIWVSSVPFTAEKKKGGDSWDGFTYERRAIANFIKANRVENLMIISGDAHCILYNNGVKNNYSDYKGEGLFEILASPLDNWATSVKGGPWTEVYRPKEGERVYGIVEVDYLINNTTVSFKAFDVNHKLLIQAVKRFEK